MRYALGDGFLDPFREAIDIGRRGGGPVHITHFYRRATYPGSAEQMIELVEEARVEGIDVTWDTYPYEWASTRLLIMLPPWVQAGGPGPLLERLADGAIRDRLRGELAARGRAYAGASPWDALRLGALTSDTYAEWEGRTLGELMAASGKDVVDATCDLLIAEDLRANQVTPARRTAVSARSWSIRCRWSAPTPPSLESAHRPAPTAPTRACWASSCATSGLMSLETAVRKMTSGPAARLGLTDRGLLRDGMRADLVVFDPLAVRSTATYDEPRSFPIGIPYVVVNGVVVVDGGVHTGATPGRALRRGSA